MKKYYIVYYYSTDTDRDSLSISNATVLLKKKIKTLDQVVNIETQIADEKNYKKVKLINWIKLAY